MPFGGLIRIGAFVMLGLGTGFQQGGADPRVGTWTLSAAQSSLTPANKLVIVSSKDDGVHVVMSGENHLDFTAKSDGHDSPLAGTPGFNQVRLRRVDKKQVEVTEKKDGAVVAIIRDKISPDGNELTTTTMATGRPDQVTVWIRTGGAKVPHDPFSGEWSEDLGKSRMKQGMTLKIDPVGRDGVHFAGDFSYTAHFDGKQYDLKNSRNDTVQLQAVDAHTVDAVYRRGDQITQRDRWIVSADGKQLTLTSSGTLESGQRLMEKLTFTKQ
ncbi:hypothetical protein [Granulicella paludicola]|uniref:hypothetical protein n=1 Tax=Granulicella paludicola TaxID=474951 RepID=UPI0021E004DD|nr:hypothetical protein [Granulicella paludicola]